MPDREHLDDDAQDEMFDGSIYDDPALVLEHSGRRVDAIRVTFGGGVQLERWQVSDVDMFKELKEGQEVEFLVTGVVRSNSFAMKKATAKRGAQLHQTKTIDVHSLEQRS